MKVINIKVAYGKKVENEIASYFRCLVKQEDRNERKKGEK